jgi:hypothetical protein
LAILFLVTNFDKIYYNLNVTAMKAQILTVVSFLPEACSPDLPKIPHPKWHPFYFSKHDRQTWYCPQYPECVPKQKRDSGNPTFPDHQSNGTKEVYATQYGIPDISPSQVIKFGTMNIPNGDLVCWILLGF